MSKKERFMHVSAVFVAALMLLAPLSLVNIFDEGRETYENVTPENILGENSFITDYSGMTQISIDNVLIGGADLIDSNGVLDKDNSVITISTPAELVKFSNLVNGNDSGPHNFSGYTVILTENIDLSETTFAPIGNGSNQFTGTFDGQGFEISNLTIDSGDQYVGLFGYIGYTQDGDNLVPGVVKNVGVVNSPIKTSTSSTAYAGGIAGRNEGGAIQNCYNTGDVEATATSEFSIAYAGGIAGRNEGGTIQNCYNTGDVTASSTFYDARAGGIAGENDTTSLIQNCYNTGTVEATATSYASAGGIAGLNYGAISNCYNTGNVEATATGERSIVNAGGIAGYGGAISNCYNTGNVEATATGEISYAYAGGIAGWNANTIQNCYNTGNVTAKAPSNESAGGIAGANIGDENLINNYYLFRTAEHGAYSWINNNGVYEYVGSYEGEGCTKSESYVMKESLFVTNLNKDQDDKHWSSDIFNLNNGFPVLADVPLALNKSELKSPVYILTGVEENQTNNFLKVSYTRNDTIKVSITPGYVLPDGFKIEYQWYVFKSEDNTFEVISGETGETYELGENDFNTYCVKITFSKEEESYTYTSFSRTIQLLEDGYRSLQFNVTPSDATVIVTDVDNKTIPNLSGTYILKENEEYTYTISKSGYFTQSETVSLSEKDKIINISLSLRPPVVFPTPEEPTADKTGNVAIPNITIQDALREAKNSKSNELIIDLSDVENALSASMTPRQITMILNGINETSINTLTILLPEGKVSISIETLSELSNATLKIVLKDVTDSIKLSEEQKKIIRDSRIYEIEVYSGSNKVTDFSQNPLKISLPYELKEGESAENIVIYYVKSDGTLEKIECTYENGFATFTINHLSNFSVVHATSESIDPTPIEPVEPTPVEPETPKQNDNTLYYALAAVIIILVALAAFYFIRKK